MKLKLCIATLACLVMSACLTTESGLLLLTEAGQWLVPEGDPFLAAEDATLLATEDGRKVLFEFYRPSLVTEGGSIIVTETNDATLEI